MVLQGSEFRIIIWHEIKVYTLSDEWVSPKRIGTMKGEDGESLANLRVRLEESKVLKFEF